MKRRDIRKARWYEEVTEYFGFDTEEVKLAAPLKRTEPKNESKYFKDVRRKIAGRFMSAESMALYEKILTDEPENITDRERSNSWKEYIFLCINAERRAFQRMSFYDQLIKCIGRPMLEWRSDLVVLDYGCGSSLFTRMLAQDFGGSLKTISADVCKYAVDFSVTRNKQFNPRASGVLIEDVMDVPKFGGIDIILAYTFFEHLPNSTEQIRGLIDSLKPGGILIENYGGHSKRTPHKSDTFDAYKCRDINLDMLRSELSLLYGVIPKKREGVYESDQRNRFWVKDGEDSEVLNKIRRLLRQENSLVKRIKKGILCVVRLNREVEI
jgi:SAM-dependent methyltransferase